MAKRIIKADPHEQIGKFVKETKESKENKLLTLLAEILVKATLKEFYEKGN